MSLTPIYSFPEIFVVAEPERQARRNLYLLGGCIAAALIALLVMNSIQFFSVSPEKAAEPDSSQSIREFAMRPTFLIPPDKRFELQPASPGLGSLADSMQAFIDLFSNALMRNEDCAVGVFNPARMELIVGYDPKNNKIAWDFYILLTPSGTWLGNDRYTVSLYMAATQRDIASSRAAISFRSVVTKFETVFNEAVREAAKQSGHEIIFPAE